MKKLNDSIKFTIFSLLALPLVLTTFSCQRNQTLKSVNAEKLFSLDYGTYEDELQLFSLKQAGTISTKVNMKDGFFFICDDSAKKIMQFTSFGDLTGIIYNPETNPTPSFIRKIGNDSDSDSNSKIKNATQSGKAYKFNSPEDVIVDSEKNIYVVDQISQERQEIDPSTNLILRETILKFSNDGKFLGYYGQEGIGGTPFSYIKDIFTTNNNELIVVTMVTDGYIVFWFNKNGSLRWKIPVKPSFMPDQNDDTFITIDRIVPDFTEPILYIKTDYYAVALDNELNVQSGIEYQKSYLHQFNIEEEKFNSSIEIPAYEDVIVDRFTKLVYKVPYEFLGTTDSQAFVFIMPDKNGLVVQILQRQNQKIIKRHISYNKNDAVFSDFSLSNRGIISALIAKNDKADIIWWRTDSLIE